MLLPRILFRLQVIFLLVVLSLCGKAQEKEISDIINVQATYHRGFLIPHRPTMKHLVRGPLNGWELSVAKRTLGKRTWESDFSFPEVGLSLYHADVGNPEVIGTATALFPFIGFPVMKGETFRMNIKVGGGLGYVSKPFDRLENHKNIAIGSHMNVAIRLAADASYTINRIQLKAGLGLTHFSNGAFRVPNLGINLPSLYTGLGYRFGDVEQKPQRAEKPGNYDDYEVLILGIGGSKEIGSPEGRSYPVYVLSGEIARAYSPKSKVSAGLDVIYNSSLLDRIEEDSYTSEIDPSIVQTGFNMAYQIRVYRLSVILSTGAYVYSKFKKDGDIYNRIGFRYQFTDFLVTHLALKSHLFVADYIEFGLGYRIGWGNNVRFI